MFDKSEPPRKFETRLKIQISTINHARGIQGIRSGDKSKRRPEDTERVWLLEISELETRERTADGKDRH